MADLTIETRANGDVGLIELSGDFDLAGVQKFETDLARIEAEGHAVVVVDLNGLSFMDSSGLGILLQIRRHAIDTGKLLTLRSLGPGTHRLLEVVGLKQLFEVEADSVP